MVNMTSQLVHARVVNIPSWVDKVVMANMMGTVRCRSSKFWAVLMI